MKSGDHGTAIPPKGAQFGRYGRVVIKPVQITPFAEQEVSPEAALEVRNALQVRLESEPDTRKNTCAGQWRTSSAMHRS
ncbi:hypothetical protein [Burkholderia ubonensis]|uniref:Uncharacterized protein n=1 Tax=Burkholderia ubonensis subsp. mesacidophila TaxID=265293 RepID=A0A2A4FGN2_9BURK|nr:hypothetical protein [Burkholderia ubonensis]PCE32883.1 hypothetical protein BZL54_07900 [Burkholderia ubonensis subsp. mesacidophila]